MPREHPDYDKLFKLRPVIDHLNKNFLSVPMCEFLSVDEQICPTNSKHHLRQYNKNKKKAHKWGYKLFVYVVYKLEIYPGQENKPHPGELDLDSSANIVVRLTREVSENQNYKVYADNFFNSIPLAAYLKNKGVLFLGTICRNRLPNCKHSTEKDLVFKTKGYSEEYCTIAEG